MAALSFSPAAVSRAIRVDGLAFTPPAMRSAALPQTASESVTVTGDGSPTGITLAKVGGAAWLTVPETCDSGTPFSVSIDASELAPGSYSEAVQATKGGFDPASLSVALVVQPVAPAPKR